VGNLGDNIGFLLYLQDHPPFFSCFRKEKVALEEEEGRALFFIDLPTSIVWLGLEDQEVPTVPQLLLYFKFVKKQKVSEHFLGRLSFAGI